jgi:hypothetical protein
LRVELTILANRVTLHRALGGGWAMLPPVKGKETEGIALLHHLVKKASFLSYEMDLNVDPLETSEMI